MTSPTPTRLDYTVTLTRPDGSVVKTLTLPVILESATACGSASSRLDFDGAGDFMERVNAERSLKATIQGLGHDACHDANDRGIAAAVLRDAGSTPMPECIRCSEPLDSDEGLVTGICADCWTEDDDDDSPIHTEDAP